MPAEPPKPPSEILRVWEFSGTRMELGAFPKLMGIVNVTPDSFSDGGEFSRHEAAVAQALKLVEEGADILDIGGESTRPYSTPVSLEEELRRVVPVIESLAKRTSVPLSIDTTKAEVARQAVANGATIINDISGLTFDPDMIPLCAETEAGIICMHIQGTPQTMQIAPHYEDVIAEISLFFREQIERLENAGIRKERIVLDPGVGFGKTARHNLEILSHIKTFREPGRPVLIGHSRKGFLKSLLGRPVEERLAGTIGVSLALADQHADILRVHDVRAVRDALTAWRMISEAARE